MWRTSGSVGALGGNTQGHLARRAQTQTVKLRPRSACDARERIAISYVGRDDRRVFEIAFELRDCVQ